MTPIAFCNDILERLRDISRESWTSIFISGENDWGVYQSPGAVEAMQERVCPRMSGVHLLPGVGHWVQQEQPAAVVKHITQLLAS